MIIIFENLSKISDNSSEKESINEIVTVSVPHDNRDTVDRDGRLVS